MDEKTICSLAWTHQFIDGTGRVKPCCRFNGDLGTMLGSVGEKFLGEKMQNLRQQMLNGMRPSGCSRCWQEEDSGKKSLRQRYNDHPELGITAIDPERPMIRWLELAISNDCNLACRMCNSRYSHRLFDEEMKIFGKTETSTRRVKIDIEQIYDNLATIKHLKITGGEPLVTPDHWRLIDHIIESGLSQNMYLNYSTNNTVFPKKSIVDRWKKFRYVELAISLDSIKKQENEYLRYPSKQEDIIQNIEAFLDLRDQLDIRIIARPTISILNVFHLPDTLEWLRLKKIPFNATHLTGPAYLSITVLPMLEKKKIEDRFSSFVYTCDTVKDACDYIKNYMMSKDDSDMLPKFKKFTKSFDESRNQSFAESYPYFDF